MTPWQKVAAKFGDNQSEIARILGRHRSKVSRALKSKVGAISSLDLTKLIEAAKEKGIEIDIADLTADEPKKRKRGS